MKAFVQIALEKGEQEAFTKLEAMQEVQEIHFIFGEWDILAKLDIPSPEALSTFIIEKVRPLPGVKLTSTMIVAK
jgi:DNA-binding Lrp family transcriptional regulator